MVVVICSSWVEILRGDVEVQGGRDYGGGFVGRDRECESLVVCQLRGGGGGESLQFVFFRSLYGIVIQ